jgi:uncharacterized protein
MVIDIHAHCFPDEIAVKAMDKLSVANDSVHYTDGTLGGLMHSMDAAGIDISVCQPIATRPEQTPGVNRWAASLKGPVVSFGTIHPDYSLWRDEVLFLADAGIHGVKFHPDYQDFFIDEDRMFPLYEAIFAAGMAILFHAGKDLAFDDCGRCTPRQLSSLVSSFPGAVIIAAHMGGYMRWLEVEEHLFGRSIYLDTSYCFEDLGRERMQEMIRYHSPYRVLFGTDSPWCDQAAEVAHVRALRFELDEAAAILGGNAERILGI